MADGRGLLPGECRSIAMYPDRYSSLIVILSSFLPSAKIRKKCFAWSSFIGMAPCQTLAPALSGAFQVPMKAENKSRAYIDLHEEVWIRFQRVNNW